METSTSVGMCVASASSDSVCVSTTWIVPGYGLADDGDRDVDGDLLALGDDEQVDVLDGVLDDVALDVLGDRQRGLAVELDGEQGVGLLHREHRLVARQRDVQRVRAVPVQDGRDLVRATQTACGALAELGTGGGDSLISDTCTPECWRRRSVADVAV